MVHFHNMVHIWKISTKTEMFFHRDIKSCLPLKLEKRKNITQCDHAIHLNIQVQIVHAMFMFQW